MENTQNQVDVEKIMEEIRQEIKSRGDRSDILSFDEIPCRTDMSENPEPFDMQYFLDCLSYLNQNNTVAGYRPLLARNRIYLFIKRAIRKLTKFYVEPIVADQNEFNANLAKLSNCLRNYINDQNIITDELSQRVDDLKLNLNKDVFKAAAVCSENYMQMKKDCRALTEKVAGLEEKLSKSERQLEETVHAVQLLRLQNEKLLITNGQRN